MQANRPHEPAYGGIATFSKLPLVLDPAGLDGVDVAILGAPFDETVSNRPGKPLRAACDPRSRRLGRASRRARPHMWLGDRPVRRDARRRLRRCRDRPGERRREPRPGAAAGRRDLRRRGDPGRPRRRPLRRPPEHGCRRRAPRQGSRRRHPLRCPRRHGRRPSRRRPLARDADAARRRRGMGARRPVHPGRAARLVARGGGVRVDAQGRVPLVHDVRARRARLRRVPLGGDPHGAGLGPGTCSSRSTSMRSIPAYAPGTGTPEVGGLTMRELLRAARRITAELPIAGMEIVEVAPAYDPSGITAVNAHRLVIEALSGLALGRSGREARPEHDGRPHV